ncbi:MAG: hypothetical protein A2V79_11685 [Betaproteobacteria bacterium RBG_16_56_24]|nr:MAG: hypothetical protein A2V79_11685 [Betaproteobacteria bacterium RBG_16_56_24]
MTDLSQVAKHLDAIGADLQALEKTLAQLERERWLHDCSTDRIPELVAEGELLADKFRMNYAVVRNLDGVFALCAAPASSLDEIVRFIPC